MQWSPVKFFQRFGEICRLHLHGRGVNQARNQQEASCDFWLLHDRSCLASIPIRKMAEFILHVVIASI
jgi:hypothetical protein